MRVQHLSLTVTLLSVLATAQGNFVDAAMGVEIKAPDRWKELSHVPDGRGVFARFRCPRVYASRLIDRFPELQLIEFSAAAKRAPEDANPARAAFRDYEHYLARSRGTHRILSTEDLTIAKIPCRRYEVRDGLNRLLAMVYTDGDRQVAVEFEVLDDAMKKISSDIERCFASFRFRDRDEPAPSAAPAENRDREWDIDRKKWRARSLQERHQHRRELEKQRWAEAEIAAKRHWKATEKNDILLITNVDKRFAQRVLGAAVAFRKICDQTFDCISDEYVRRVVLRVQDSDKYYRSFSLASIIRGFELDDDRMVVVEKIDGNSVLDLRPLYNEILDLYLRDKDVYFHRYMPQWLHAGLHAFVARATPKGRKLEFRRDDYGREGLAELVRERKLMPLRDLLQLSDGDYTTLSKDDRRVRYQAAAFVRYLFGPGRKSKLTKTFFETYSAAVIAVSEKHAETWDDKADTATILEKEAAARKKALEEAFARGDVVSPENTKPKTKTQKVDPAVEKQRLRRKLWLNRRKAISKDIGAAAFSFTDKEWKALDKAFYKFVK